MMMKMHHLSSYLTRVLTTAVSDLLGVSEQDRHTKTDTYKSTCQQPVQETADPYLHLTDERLIVIKFRMN